jgi:hypothetical protein
MTSLSARDWRVAALVPCAASRERRGDPFAAQRRLVTWEDNRRLKRGGAQAKRPEVSGEQSAE